MPLLQVITKVEKKWKNSGLKIEDSGPIQENIYKNSGFFIEFFPSFLYVVEIKDGNVFVESLINVLRSLSANNDLEDEDFKSNLYKKLVKNYTELSQDQFENAIFYTTVDDDKDEIIEDIKNIGYTTKKKEEDIQEDDEEIEEDEDPIVKILRFKSSFGKIEKVNLQIVYDSLPLNSDHILAKTLYGNEPAYMTSEDLGNKKSNAINEFIFSEHFSDPTKKILVKGVINILYRSLNSNFYVKISDTGNIGIKIEPDSMSYDKNSDITKDIKDSLKVLYKIIKKDEEYENIGDFKDFDIKILYPSSAGYFSKKAIAGVENAEVKNNKVEYTINNNKVWYSPNRERLNFTVKNLSSILSIQSMVDSVENRVSWYNKNLTSIVSIKLYDIVEGDDHRKVVLNVEPHGLSKKKGKVYHVKISDSSFDGIYKIDEFTSKTITIRINNKLKTTKNGRYIFSSPLKKQSIVMLRRAGLIVNSKECPLDRRPILLGKKDKSTGNDILDIGDRKFKCVEPFTYHGVINKVNCCYKTERENDSKIKKKKPLKLFYKMKKGSEKLLEGSLVNYLPEDFFLVAPEDKPEDRTITNCLLYSYGENIIEESISNLSEEDYEKYFKNGQSLDSWRSTENKSIGDVLLAVSIHKFVKIIIFIESPSEGLYVKCSTSPDSESSLLIYKSSQKTESYYLISNKKVLVHEDKTIKELLEVVDNSCGKGFSESMLKYKRIAVSQIFDYQNLVVFLEISSGGYIPITPSTIDSSMPSISISSIKLLTPEAQYLSLDKSSKDYPELKPIGVTKIFGEEIITGIQLENGGVSPVSHSKWESNLLPTSKILFYIERYSYPEEIFEDKEVSFVKNLGEFYSITDIDTVQDIVKSGDYSRVISIIKDMDLDKDQASRLAWFVINNN